MSGSRAHDGHPDHGVVELTDLDLRQRGDDPAEVEVSVPDPGGQGGKKRAKGSVGICDEVDTENGRSPKRPKLELENSDDEKEDLSRDPLSEKARGKLPARSPELEEVLPMPELDDVQESQSGEPPQTQFDGREQSPTVEPFTAYTCPICFGVVTNATMTPCGHVCCGECLFSAVEASIGRARFSHDAEGAEARCPVCRAKIPGWDGVGGGVIGLIPKTVIAL